MVLSQLRRWTSRMLKGYGPIRTFVVLLPMCMGLLFIVLSLLPQSFQLMQLDGPRQTPWYTPFTTLLFIPLMFYVYPTTLASMGFGGPSAIQGPIHFLLVLAYSGYISSILGRILKPKSNQPVETTESVARPPRHT